MTSSSPSRLWNRHFLLYWLGVATSALGQALVFVALPFLVFGLSDSPAALATAVMLASLPRFLAPLTGALADRLPLKLPLAATSLLRSLIFGAVALMAGAGALTLEMLYLASFLSGLVTVFTVSAGAVAVPHLVPEAQLGRANSLMVGAMMGLPLAGYGLAGGLVATVGAAATLALATPLFAVLALALPWVALPPAAPRSEQGSVLADIAEGARFVLARSELLLLMVLSLALNAALSTLSVLMPVTMQSLGQGAAGYGLFSSLLSAGALAGTLSVILLGRRLQPGSHIALGNALIAVGFMVFAAGGFESTLAGALVAGLGLGMLEVAGITFLQRVAPHGMRGKLFGLVVGVNALGLTGGAWLAGQAAGWLPVASYYALAASFTGLLSLLWLFVDRRREPAQTALKA